MHILRAIADMNVETEQIEAWRGRLSMLGSPGPVFNEIINKVAENAATRFRAKYALGESIASAKRG